MDIKSIYKRSETDEVERYVVPVTLHSFLDKFHKDGNEGR